MLHLFLALWIFANPLPGKADSDTIYTIIVDRFYDGDASNNVPYYAYPGHSKYETWNKRVLPLMFDPQKTKWNKYWGGDIKGLINKLDYIKELGVSAILISPVFQNVNGYISIKGTQPRITAYHGYWLKDLYRLDEHFISYDKKSRTPLYEQGDQEFKTLIAKAHKLGLKVFLDININHTSPVREGLKDITELTEYELQDGAIFKNGTFISARSASFYERFELQANAKNWFHQEPSIIWDKDTRKKLSPAYKELGYSLDGEGPSTYERNNFMLHGLADLNHEDSDVRNYIINAMVKWTEMGVDGYRIDAIRHMPKSFIRTVKKQLQQKNPNLLFIGEWFDFGRNNKEALSFSKDLDIPLFDFEKMNEIRKIYLDGKTSYKKLKELLRHNNYKSIIFIENQDIPRVLSTKNIDLKLYDEMLKLILVLKGPVCIYYGTEQYLHDDSYKHGHSSFGTIGGDPWNRDQMKWGLKDHKNKKAYKIIRTMSELRGPKQILSEADIKVLDTDDELLVVERSHKGKTLLYAASISSTKKLIEVKTSLKDGVYNDLIEKTAYTIKDGKFKTTIKPFSTILLF